MNPLLAKIRLPGRVFQLPSKGVFYAEGVLDPNVKDGEVHVSPLSAIAELKLRSPDLLLSGKIIREICSECIPEILKPELLLSKDIDAIFCFLRIVTYGSNMTVRSTHTCAQGQLHDYQVDIEAITLHPNNTVLNHRENLYSLTLSNGQEIKLKPVRFIEMIDVTILQQELARSIAESGARDQALIQKVMLRDTISVIESVDGIADEKMIEEWLRFLKKSMIDEILDYSAQINQWGFNLTVKLKCKDCGEEYDHNLDLDPINFFSA